MTTNQQASTTKSKLLRKGVSAAVRGPSCHGSLFMPPASRLPHLVLGAQPAGRNGSPAVVALWGAGLVLSVTVCRSVGKATAGFGRAECPKVRIIEHEHRSQSRPLRPFKKALEVLGEFRRRLPFCEAMEGTMVQARAPRATAQRLPFSNVSLLELVRLEPVLTTAAPHLGCQAPRCNYVLFT